MCEKLGMLGLVCHRAQVKLFEYSKACLSVRAQLIFFTFPVVVGMYKALLSQKKCPYNKTGLQSKIGLLEDQNGSPDYGELCVKLWAVALRLWGTLCEAISLPKSLQCS